VAEGLLALVEEVEAEVEAEEVEADDSDDGTRASQIASSRFVTDGEFDL
jgi:hypothetical protein